METLLKLRARFIGLIILIFFGIFFIHGHVFSQSVSLPTDHGRVTIKSINDTFNITGPKLKVLRTDTNTPLRAGTSWVWSKGTENTESYYISMANYGLNAVRIIQFDTWENEHYTPSAVFTPTNWNDPVFRTAQLARLERAVNWASAHGLYVIIDSHDDVGAYDETYANALWTYVAPYFANRTHVLYELANEPMAGIGTNGNMDMAAAGTAGALTSPRLQALARTYNIARAAAPNTMLLILSPTGISDYGIGTGMGNAADAFAILANQGTAGKFDVNRTAVALHLYHDDGGVASGYNAGNLRNLLSRYAAWPSENNFAPGVTSASLNITDDFRSQSFSTQYGTDAYVSQTCERLGIGWSMWNMEGQSLLDHNWPIYWADAVAKGWTWPIPAIGNPTKYEAENATLNGVNVATSHAGYSGTGFAEGFMNQGNYVQFNVSGATAGNQNIACHYSNGYGANHTLSLYINGTKIKQISFAPTANWDSWADEFDNIILVSGNNTIKYQYDPGDNGNFNIDYLSVTSNLTTDSQAPSVPTALVSSSITTTGFTLSWNASTDNVAVTGYEVFKDGISVGTTISTSLNVTGLTASTTYNFTVKARDAVPNWSATSAALPVTTLGAISNLALKKPAAASSQASSTYSAAKAVDGNAATQWRSNSQTNPWIYVDLGAPASFNRVVLTWSTYYATAYTIQTSTDAKTWNTVSTLNGQNGGTDDITGISGVGRYVRIYATARSNNSNGVRLIGFEVYGSLKSASISEETTIAPEPESDLRLYPNPASDWITISNAGWDSDLSVYSIEGKLVIRKHSFENDFTIDVSNWRKGMYILVIRNSIKTLNRKFIVR